MRTLTFDWAEFEDTSGEEELELWIAARSRFPYPNVLKFIETFAAARGKTLGPPVEFAEHMSHGRVRKYLKYFANIDVPRPCRRPTYVLVDDNDEWDGAFDAGDHFVRYHWSTSA